MTWQNFLIGMAIWLGLGIVTWAVIMYENIYLAQKREDAEKGEQ